MAVRLCKKCTGPMILTLMAIGVRLSMCDPEFPFQHSHGAHIVFCDIQAAVIFMSLHITLGLHRNFQKHSLILQHAAGILIWKALDWMKFWEC